MKTHMCDIILVGDEMGLHFIHLETGDGKRKFELNNEWEYNNSFFKETIREIEEYFQGKRKRFTIKLSPMGTDYQKMVWKELTGISYGKLNTYKEIAEKIGNLKAARAVGMANSKNPIPIVIPCHRVVGVSGKLTGFAYGLEIKEKLINFEKMITIYDDLKNMIEGSIKSDLELYGEYHALIVEHAKNFCNKNPKCKGCPLEIYCEKNI